MKSKGHSLWLMSTEQANEKFVNLVKKLAKENNAPVFQPHVTLLGDFMFPEEECVAKTKQLVSGQQPFTVKLGEIDYEDFYFRTLFVRAEKSEPLLALNNRARGIFQMQNTPPFMPHLSILYGIVPVETKEKIMKEIGRDQSAELEVNKVTLVKGGEIKDWQIIGEFEFTPTSEVETY